MNFDISSVQGLRAAAPVRPTGRTGAPDTNKQVASTEAVKVDVKGIPDSPPAEVLDAMGVAAAAHDRLAQSDRGLSFKIDEVTGKVVVEVHDNHGQVLFTVPGAKALEIAAGAALEQ